MESSLKVKKPFGYPEARKGPDEAFFHVHRARNPVLRGVPLLIATFLVSTFDFIAAYLWRNAGFAGLRTIKELCDYEPRWDPTVIPDVNVMGQALSMQSFSSHAESSYGHYSISDYHSAYKSGRLDPLSVAHGLLDLITPPSKYDVIFLDIRRSELLAAAERSAKRFQEGKPLGMLDGIPVAVKDEVDITGCRKTLGSRNDFTRSDGRTSWCVQKWEDAGALVLGTLNMHELGLDTTNNNPIHGTPSNPHSAHHYPGGSSGGSAAAVSIGLIPLALGADGGGSIRIPSSFCAIAGLKPTHGRVSISPTPSLDPSVCVVGPMATNIADLAIGYSIMAAPDQADQFSAFFPPPHSPLHTLNRTVVSSKRTIGIYQPWFDCAESNVLTQCSNILDKYKSYGWNFVPITIPFLSLGQKAHAMTILSEISSSASSLATASTQSGIPIFSPATRLLLSIAKQTPAQDFILAQKLRNLLMQHISYLFQKHPGMIIVTPTTPNLGWRIQDKNELSSGLSDADMSLRSMEYVWLANFVGCPALSVPVALVEMDGMVNGPKMKDEGRVPLGLMGMGEWGNEMGVLEWGKDGEDILSNKGESTLDWRPEGQWVDVFKLAGEWEKKEKENEARR